MPGVGEGSESTIDRLPLVAPMGTANDAVPLTVEAIVTMVIFSIASASMLLINKGCLHLLPAPSFVAVVQFAATSLSVVVIKYAKLAPVDDWEWEKVRPYILYCVMFVACIYANLRALSVSNVETLIVFRSCVPCVVACSNGPSSVGSCHHRGRHSPSWAFSLA